MILLQKSDFDAQKLITSLVDKNLNVGAISSFIGLVRKKNNNQELKSMKLEHYPEMAKKILNNIEQEAHQRWSLIDTLIVHRYGTLFPGEQIVLVTTISEHRKDAIDSCHFLIDWLKTKGPFWKLEHSISGEQWVEAKRSDDIAADKWKKSN